MSRYILLMALIALPVMPMHAQKQGSLDANLLEKLKASYTNSPTDKALHNAIATTDIDRLAINNEYLRYKPTRHFSDKVESNGITDQKSSGRCWLFTGLNVLRSQIMAEHGIKELKLSQNYNFFFDQLEKSNLFLQGIIETADKGIDDEMVQWLLKNPLSDGGQYTGLSHNLMKYGVVPDEAMPETFSSNNTAKMRRLISLKLREDALELRKMVAKGASNSSIQDKKEEQLKEIYRMLALTLGVPPTEFKWTRTDELGSPVDTRTYTPQSFYKEYVGNELAKDYVMVMNDPTRQYYKLYEIDFDRHAYDAGNWTFVNLPIEDIKEMAIASIRDGRMMYFSCDVGKFLDRENGILDVDNLDYESLFGVKFGMDKADRIRTYASGSTHAMTLMAVDIDAHGKPTKWMVENSWGNGANNGHLIMTDRWFDEYMFRLVVNKKYVPNKVLEILKQKPEKLPAWDPMY